jgi:integrase
MKGSIRPRGKKSWELKFDIGAGADGGRKIAYRSFKGTKKQAEAKLAEYVNQLGKGEYIAPSKQTVAEFLGARIKTWVVNGLIGSKSAERYGELLRNQITPKIGHLTLQNLSGIRLSEWHGELLSGGLSPQTVKTAHGLLGKALKEAVRDGIIARNAAANIPSPRVPERDMAILQREQVPMLIAALQGDIMLPMAACALYAGLRRGEVLALRWNAIDLEAGSLAVVASLEQLVDGTLTFKAPKTKAGRRLIAMPDALISILRAHRLEQLQLRMKLGLGKLPDDALLFANLQGRPRSPRAISKKWGMFADRLGIGNVRFHDLRHTQASLLHDAKVPLAVVSKRLGHSKISTTLNIYTHLFQDADSEAATALNASLGGGK